MGDRGNIALQYEGNKEKRVWLYTHWRGYEMGEIVAEALKRGKERWNDPPYLGRVIFDELIGGDKDVTGYGIDVQPGDNGHPFLVVCIESRTVFRESDTRKGFGILVENETDAKPVGFDDFITKHAKPVAA